MITQAFLNSEIDLVNRIFIYYTDKILDALEIGAKDYQQWYRDSCQIGFIKKALESTYLLNNKIYIGSGEITEAQFLDIGSKAREFLNAELRQIVYSELNSSDILQTPTIPSEPAIVFVQGETYGWAYYVITILTDDPATVALPFNISSADVNSLTVTVNDHDPDALVAPEAEGCHIIGTTLYWHNYYNLKTNDQLVIRFQTV